MLTQEQVDQFWEDGCLVVPGYLSAEKVLELNEEIKQLYKEIDLKTHPLTKFDTKNDSHIGDDYFLGSSDKVRSFFEIDAFDANGNLIKPLDKSINKIGHGLHFLNSKFSSITVNEDISAICKQLAFKEPRALQSMIIVKQPEIGGRVPSHQDGEFLYTEPQSCIGFWFALEDCTTSNGCLSFIPGSHKSFPIERRFVKDFKNGGTKFVDPITGEDWVEDEQSRIARNDESKFRMVEIPAGDLVLIHNRVVHKSERNTSLKSRNAYTFHVIEGENEYDKYNWLQMPPENPQGTKCFTKL